MARFEFTEGILARATTIVSHIESVMTQSLLSANSGTTATLTNGFIEYKLTGTGLTFQTIDGTDRLIGGTLDDVLVILRPSYEISYSGLGFSGAHLASIAQTDNRTAPGDGFEKMLSALDWEYHGNSTPDHLSKSATSTDSYPFAMNGNDTVYLEYGEDAFFLAFGDDTAFGGMSNDIIWGGQGDDRIAGGAHSDTLYGNRDDDVLYGGGHHDSLYGGWGRDVLRGGDGDDWISGDRGRDILFGGAGADVFYLHDNTSHDVIVDFEDGTDLLDIGTTLYSVTASGGTDTLITWGNSAVTLKNTDPATIDTDDFI